MNKDIILDLSGEFGMKDCTKWEYDDSQFQSTIIGSNFKFCIELN